MAITPVKTLVSQAKREITTLPVDEARRRAESGEALLVDIRDIRELQREGRVPGAMHVPRGMLEFWIDPDSPYHKPVFNQDKTYVFYCASAWRSALSAKIAMEMGLQPVMHLEGGFTAWEQSGGAVVPRST